MLYVNLLQLGKLWKLYKLYKMLLCKTHLSERYDVVQYMQKLQDAHYSPITSGRLK